MATPALIVDDDGGIRGLLRAVLGRRGIECDFAADGAEALEKLERNDYCVVVLDLMMPRLDGYKVLERLGDLGRDVPVVVMTASVMGGLAGIDRDRVVTVLPKPFDIDQLEEAVAKTMCGEDHSLPAAS